MNEYQLFPPESSPPPVPPEPSAAEQFNQALLAATPIAYLTPALIVLNVGVFAAMVASGVGIFEPSPESMVRWGADLGIKTVGGQWWRMLTAQFLHVGLVHIGMNMAVLYGIGTFMERLLGRPGYLALYLLCGIGGNLASLWWNPYVVSAGASGAIFGLYGALLAYALRCRSSLPMEVLEPLRKGALVFLGYNLLYGLLREEVDLAGHLGGLAAGFVLGLFLARPIEAAAGRLRRAALATAVGLLATVVLAARMPIPVDFAGDLKRFGVVEQQVIGVYQAALEKLRNGNIRFADLARTVEQEVLPPWKAQWQLFAAMKGLPKRQQQVAALLTRYMAKRQEGWTEVAEGARTDSIEKIAGAQGKQEEAEKVLKELEALAKR